MTRDTVLHSALRDAVDSALDDLPLLGGAYRLHAVRRDGEQYLTLTSGGGAVVDCLRVDLAIAPYPPCEGDLR